MPRKSRGTENERAADGRRIYSLGDVTRYTQVPRPQSQYWLKHRVLVPDYRAEGGPGKYHGFSFRNLVEFTVAHRLSLLGANLGVMCCVLEYGLRLEDPDDWYEVMPRLSDEIDAVLKKKERPTKKQALAWFDEHEGHLDFKDPEVAAEFSRHAEASGLFEDDPPLSEAKQDKLALWRQFKDPSTRLKVGPPVLICYPLGIVFGGLSDVEGSVILQGGYIPVVLLNLTAIFEHLESVTGDHWNNVEVRP